MPLLLHDPVARWLVVAAVLAMVVGEVVATYLGQARDGKRRLLGSLAESLLLVRRRGAAVPQDRWTLWIIVLASRAGVVAALAIAALVPGLRAYANNWWTLGSGVAIVLAGVALRGWAILTLGRYFRREVTIKPGQRLVRRGPYQLLRHPAYAGIFLSFAGLGLAFGSWVSAAVALLIVFVGMLPRIRVEERALAQAFGADYADYSNSTARVLPHVGGGRLFESGGGFVRGFRVGVSRSPSRRIRLGRPQFVRAGRLVVACRRSSVGRKRVRPRSRRSAGSALRRLPGSTRAP